MDFKDFNICKCGHIDEMHFSLGCGKCAIPPVIHPYKHKFLVDPLRYLEQRYEKGLK